MNAVKANSTMGAGRIVPVAVTGFAQVAAVLASASGDETIAKRLAYITEFEKDGAKALVTSFGFDGGESATFAWPDRQTFENFLESPEFTGRQLDIAPGQAVRT